MHAAVQYTRSDKDMQSCLALYCLSISGHLESVKDERSYQNLGLCEIEFPKSTSLICAFFNHGLTFVAK